MTSLQASQEFQSTKWPCKAAKFHVLVTSVSLTKPSKYFNSEIADFSFGMVTIQCVEAVKVLDCGLLTNLICLDDSQGQNQHHSQYPCTAVNEVHAFRDNCAEYVHYCFTGHVKASDLSRLERMNQLYVLGGTIVILEIHMCRFTLLLFQYGYQTSSLVMVIFCIL